MSPTHRSTSQEARALEEAFLQYWERIYRVLFRLTGDTAEAEDLALETFLRLWKSPPLDDRGLGGWLYRVATHLGYNSLRSRWRRWQHEQRAGRAALDDDDPGTPESAIERSDERQRVRAVLARLPERQSKLLILRHSGLSYQEIAAALGINPASIGTLLARAEQAFLEQYSGDIPTPAAGDEKGADDASE